MTSRRSTFRPTVQMLETRRCMAAAVGELVNEPDALTIPITIGAINDAPLMDAVSATPTEPAAPAANATVTDTTISGNTANQEGGGIWNITAEEEHQEAALLLPAVHAARGDGTNNGQNYVFLSLGHASSDAFFSGLGDDTTSDAGEHTYVSGGIYTITVTIIDDDTGQANDATDAFFSEVGSGDSEGTDMDPFSYNYGKIEIVY
jgi:hypothetical protein